MSAVESKRQRKQCSGCGFTESMCICAYRANVQPSHRIIVLQHPSEVKSSKGTVQLLPLVIPSVEIVIGETSGDFADIAAQIQAEEQPVYVLYPGDNAEFIECLPSKKYDDNQESVDRSAVVNSTSFTLIFLDGTWRKTVRMWCSNSWLHALPQLTFKDVPTGEYVVRKAKREDSLSTIEAVYHTLRIVDNIDVSPILKIFQQRVAMQLAFFPHSD